MAAPQTISITQALAQIKLIRKRIDNVIEDGDFIRMKTKKSLFDGDRYSSQAIGSYQSFTDLLKLYNKMKAAIVVSNATTTVNIAGKSYTVAEAVERKRSIEMEKELLNRMKMQYVRVMKEYEAHQLAEQARVERLLAVELGKDSKTSPDTIRILSESFLAENKAEIVDPLHLETKIKSMGTEIDEFETTVDYTLSESNGRTMITI
jgi:hypothetical protein